MFRFFRQRRHVEIHVTRINVTLNFNDGAIAPPPQRLGRMVDAKLLDAAQREPLLLTAARLLQLSR